MGTRIYKEKQRKISRATKIIAMVTLILITIGVLFTVHMLKIAELFGQSYMESAAKQTASNFRGRIRTDFQVLSRLANSMTSHTPNFSEEEIYDFMLKTVNNAPDRYQRMSFTYPDGKNIRVEASTGKIGPNKDVTGLRCYDSAMQGVACFQDGYKEPLAKSGMVNRYYVPVYNHSGKIAGVLGVMLDTNMFAQILEFNNLDNKAYTHVIYSDGTYLVKSSHEKNTSSNFFTQVRHLYSTTKQAICENLEEDISGTFWYKNKNGKVYLAAYADIGHGVNIITDISKDSIMLNFNRILYALLVIIVIVGTLLICQLVYMEKTYSENEKNLFKLAFEDEVTEGNNKSKFIIDTKAILASKRDKNFALISMDITKFKIINELFGFTRSNTILKDVYNIVLEKLPKHSLCARDFAATFVILFKYDEESEIIDFINSIVNDVKEYNEGVMKNLIPNSEMSVSSKLALNFGIYIIRNRGLSVNIMCDRASIAKRNIKGDVVNIYKFYDDELRSKLLQDKAIEDEMHAALKENQYKMYLQPKFDLQTMKLAGAEALVRWIHPQKGTIPPNSFIPVFEKNSFIIELDKCIWRQACEFLAERKRNNLELFPISVNVSRLHLNNDAFINGLYSLTQEYGISPEYLELEITESACFDNTQRFSDIIYKLKSYGFKIAMDDFGIGYSSLNMLRTLPVDILKLDRGFIIDIIGNEDKKGEVVIKNILKMANELGIQTIGEGIETPEQAEFLKVNGCRLVQGFLYGRPVNVETFTKQFLESDNEITL